MFSRTTYQIFVVPQSPFLKGRTYAPSSYGGACRATNARLIVVLMLMMISLHADSTTSSSSFTDEACYMLTVAASTFRGS